MRIKKAIILNVLLAVSVFGVTTIGFSYYKNDVSDFVDVTLDSKVLNESRKVFIRFPDDFDKNKAYPLIIKTDGYFNLANWDKALKALNTESILNEAILVAIPNQFFIDTRNRDLVPPYARKDVNTNPRSKHETSPEIFGKADLFFAFIEQELLIPIRNNT
ncbi:MULTISPECIES: alpha/beta hydrolase-fold protein [unclassified Pseudoalteromonas]|uniref:alpha/beta hydrolase-fold protein n=1 Tax=unclassified Pseudoalteromonas TaxID=194690 RepID=UPI0025B5C3A2|nr:MULTISPECIES: alpha/beta hydrolase-fold protein [unclassified Pseudoalteromonas]MDN3393515.1 alpha/beta hydrolase-fold protein [Pseudoalteromonas sp. APC 3215]MDN3469425.1 alpha/beta hydrolase-fold protein [Pseudoalteromonas sp. APC 4026]